MTTRVARIFAFSGKFGSGKSNFMSYFGTRLGGAYRAAGVVAPLWANFSLQDSIPVRSIPELYLCGYPHGPWGVLELDELHDTVDSRQSSGMANRPFLEWYTQCRKGQTDVLMATQVLDQIDKRVRRMLSGEFHCLDIGGERSQIDLYEIDEGTGDRLRRVNSFVWYRPWAYGLYSHLERAWPLEAGGAKAAPASRPVVPPAVVVSSSSSRKW